MSMYTKAIALAMLIIIYITARTMYDLECVYLSPMQTIKIQSVKLVLKDQV